MSYWLFALLFGFAIAMLTGVADLSIFLFVLLIAAPLFLLGLMLRFFRSIFSRSVALSGGQIIAGLAALGFLATYWMYYAPYF